MSSHVPTHVVVEMSVALRALEIVGELRQRNLQLERESFIQSETINSLMTNPSPPPEHLNRRAKRNVCLAYFIVGLLIILVFVCGFLAGIAFGLL